MKLIIYSPGIWVIHIEGLYRRYIRMQTNKTFFCNNSISRPRAPLTATCSIVSSLADVHCMLALCRYQGSSLTYILNLQLINSLVRPVFSWCSYGP